MDIRPQQMEPAKMAEIEAHYCTGATPTSELFSLLVGHIKWQEVELAAGQADPAKWADTAGVIQPDSALAGKFTFVPTSELRRKAEAVVPDKKRGATVRTMPAPGTQQGRTARTPG